MRLAIISDIHGNLAALEAVLADVKTRGADLAVNLGDCCTSPLWPRETMELLDTLKLPTVRGNHDRSMIDWPRERMNRAGAYTYDSLTAAQRAALGALPRTVRLAGGILAVHGTPASDTTYLLEDKHEGRLLMSTRDAIGERLAGIEASVVLCGHSHHANVAFGPGDCLIVNPGSVGCPLFGDGPDAPQCDARAPHARYAIMTKRRGRWAVDLIALDYDWDAAAERARANGREDWAAVYTSGYYSGTLSA
jgi:predicted phosphodiesterase